MRRLTDGPVAVGVVLPVHNEEQLLPAALDALGCALAELPSGIETRVAIVLDDCQDSSGAIAEEWSYRHGALIVPRRAGNVGAARRAGCDALLDRWPRIGSSAIWLATTDADSRVPVDWLSTQVSARRGGVDLWAGRVRVTDWSGHGERTRSRWTANYETEPDPVHGASLGVAAATYRSLGGFRALPTGEDRDLYLRAKARHCRVLHDRNAVVETSARCQGRAPLGFAHALMAVAEELAPTA